MAEAARGAEPSVGDGEPSAGGSADRQLPVLLLAALIMYTAQQVLLPVLAPLSREVGLTELQLGVVISAAAVVLMLSAAPWGRACGTIGHRRVLLIGLSCAAAGLTLFAVTVQVALSAAVPPSLTFALMLLTRGLMFGVGLAAVPVAVLAFIAAVTLDTGQRTGRVSRLNAAQGLSVALGPALGAVLAFAGLLGPVWAAPALLGIAVLVVAIVVPATARRPAPVRAPARDLLRRSDIWPYLLAAFALLLSLGLVVLTVGFLIQDRLGLDADQTARATGAVLFGCGLVLVVVQGVLVPRLRWSPNRLLRVGSPVAAAGLATLAAAGSLPVIAAGMLLLALGLGAAGPGYTAGPTLRVPPRAQGAVAGLVTATTGATFVIGPLAGSALYELGPSVPFAAAAVATGLTFAFVLAHPTFRSSQPLSGTRS